METAAIVALVAVAAVLFVFMVVYFTQMKYERRFRQWQEAERLRAEDEKSRTVRESVAQSRAVLSGKFTEQMTPYLPEFRYDPTEARFIGTPIDMVIFPGLARGEPKEIVIMEIKTGKTGQLTPQQRKIRQLIEEGMVRWEEIHKPAGNGEPPENLAPPELP